MPEGRSKRFDLIVIGTGPGGYVAAIRAAQLGMRVACVEKEALGGACLNVGCIPSKALLESSELFSEAQTTFHRHGIDAGKVRLDLGRMMQRKDGVVQNMTRGVAGLFRKNRVTCFRGAARLVSADAVDVVGEKGTERVNGARILIATGSVPIELPNLPFDGTHILSSTEALCLSDVPERLVVIGAGAIGLELGSVWHRLGSSVRVVEMLDHIVPRMDREMGTHLQRLLERQGLEFLLETRAETSDVKDGKVHLQLATGSEKREEVCDRLLVAVGRRARTEGLNAEGLGVELDEAGRIAVDEQFETSVPGVYAVGDVIAGPMLAHKAEEEGIAAVETMAGHAGRVNYEAIPEIVYTRPELASVGITEEGAEEQGLRVRVGKFPFRANGRAHSLEATEGLVKIIGEEGTDRLLGMHILGVRASEMIAEGVVALEFVATTEDIARSVHAHPTMPEAIKEAALAVDRRAIHM